MSKEPDDPAGHDRPPGNRSMLQNALSQFRVQNPYSFTTAPIRPHLSASSGIGIFTPSMPTPSAPSSSNEGPTESAAATEQNQTAMNETLTLSAPSSSNEGPTESAAAIELIQDDPSHVTVSPIRPLETNEDAGEDLAANVSPDADNIGQLGGRENDFGLGPFKGLHVRANIEMGPFVKPTIKLKFVVRHLSQSHLFAEMIIPLDYLVDKPHIVDIDSEDKTSLMPLLSHVPTNLDQLGSSQTVPDPFPSIVPGDDGRPACDIHQATDTIRTLRLDVASQDVIIIKTPSFQEERENHPQTLCSVADDVLGRLVLPSVASIRLWFFPEKTFHDTWWTALENIDRYVQPYTEILHKVRTNYADLSYGNFEMADLAHPEKPVPSTNVFVDAEHQTVSVMGGAIEEIVLADELAEKLWESNLQAVVIKDPYTTWESKDDDLQVYGIAADKQPLRWYFIVDLSNGVADMFPDVDIPFKVYIRTEYDARTMPSNGFSAEQVHHVTNELLRNFRLAETKGEMAESRCQQDIDKAAEKGYEAREERLTEKLQTIRNDVFKAFAASFLYGILPQPSAEAIAEHARKPLNVQLAATAQHLAEALRQRDDENDIDWGNRVRVFVRENGPGRSTQGISGYGEAFTAIVRDLPPGTAANIGLLEVKTANQSNWPIGLKKPPVKLSLPHVTIKGPLHEFLSNIWVPVKDAPASTTYKTVTFKAWFKPDDTSIKAECAAVTEINSLGENAISKNFWTWAQCFGENKNLHNWLVQYPALGRQVEAHEYTGERHDVLSRLDRVPFGYAAITGPPGSGKTSLAEDIVLSVISEPCNHAEVTVYPPMVQGQATSEDGPDHESDSGSEDDLDHESDSGNDGEPDHESDSGNDGDFNEAPTEPATFTAWPNDETNQEQLATFTVGPQLPEAWETEPLGNQQEEAIGVAVIPRVAWLVAENQLCNDAQVRLSIKRPDAVILRARPWKKEMNNMYSQSDREPDLISMENKPHATSQDRRLANYINHQIQDRFNESSASRGPTTISEYAKRLARENPAEWNDYLHAYRQKITDPEAFNLNRVDNERHARELLIHVASLTAVLCCTPVTFGQIKNHTGLEYNFIVLDEAARMPESLSLIPMAKCPEASFLIVGDNKQFGPVVTTLDRKDWQSFFGPQRATSLFERIEKSGALLFRLKSNYRAHRKAADFVREKFYEGQMHIVNKTSTVATTGIADYIASKTGSLYPNIMVDIPEAQEIQIGTSYANPATARLAVSLAIQVYREASILNARDADQLQRGEVVKVRRGSILIITMYAVQKRNIELLLKEATSAELPPGLVEVRTVDGSLSHSGAVVIVDIVRTGRRGFIDDPRRVAVAFSRAELCTILIARERSVQERSRLGSAVQFLKERDAVYSLGRAKSRPQWTEWCSRCLQPGHVAHGCKQTIRCTTCNETHATRYCPQANTNEISLYAEDPVTADDGVSRNVFASRGVPKNREGKRVAFRGQERAARKPPTSIKTEVKNEYKRAAKALHSAQQDGDGGNGDE
ncbi:uncharacterized protein FFB20_02444 [Fusarium fujikuroi]|nr:uncharacterized protein FFB20_02444 [Fusarium fujikuroi]SCN82082.1 uncharacterized protein FFE2_04956 [Fusarium fujikuroi]SCN84679.1 uncharacterized protein FFM5_03446 [Fusarium fujikuroi]SCN84792.1 uncharacterized protein FFC1_04687 [Fusarium fujikuroi]SCO34415.1 uncharacterized protein FFNC_03814 [Fusarium fujikuroi]